MKKQCSTPFTLLGGHPAIILFMLLLCFGLSCRTAKKADQVVDRTSIPEARADVPSGISEIRELKFNHIHKEDTHKDLHFSGRIFTKEQVNGITKISPCSNCTVLLRGVTDTSTVARLTTESDGYFSFHGQVNTYSLTLNNPGYNQVFIDRLEFEPEGITSLLLVNAKGNATERFSVSKIGSNYTWTKVQ
jgi:hypothetical protein